MIGYLSKFMLRNPFVGPVIAAGLLSTAGDVLAQQLVEKKGSKHDFRRTLRFATYGFLIIGPASCIWFRALEKLITFGSPFAVSVQKVLLDQIVFSPIFLGVFFTYNGIMEGHDFQGIRAKFESSYFEAIKACLKVWPAVQLVNFFIIPLHFRVVFVNMVALGWTAFLSTLNSRSAVRVKCAQPVTDEYDKLPNEA